MVEVFPAERARRLVAHDHLVAVEELLASRRQLEIAHLRPALGELARCILEVGLRRVMGDRPARRAAQADARLSAYG